MKYEIELVTADPNRSAEAVISAALGFEKELKNFAIVGLFTDTEIFGSGYKDGRFRSKKMAVRVAEKINNRAAFGGFGPYFTTAVVREAA